ncbi:acyl-(acyl-carrier-protein)-UDP-N-acetylglucosamine O-acyltransferase [Acrasis kona]|uniref:Acyl-(Acyl-carrier-protein)-UDP-N-acetylglucosamine O-acyltransferase n=1 Tax=Acrasis kona TaxID=1008807 RepID=A0AAW2YXZ4_9EUKA
MNIDILIPETIESVNKTTLSDFSANEIQDAYRKCLIEERRHRIDLQNKLYQFSMQMEKLQKQLFEKVAFHLTDQALTTIAKDQKTLQEKNISLEEKIEKLKSKQSSSLLFAKSSSKPIRAPSIADYASSRQPQSRKTFNFGSLPKTSSNFLGLIKEQDDALLSRSFVEKKQPTEEIISKSIPIIQPKESICEQLLDEGQNKQLEELQIQHQNLIDQNKICNNRIEELQTRSKQLLERANFLEKDNKRLTLEASSQKQEREDSSRKVLELEELVHQNEEELKTLRKSNLEKEEDNSLLSRKMLIMKQEMSIVKLQLRKFNVYRVRSFLPNSQAVIVLHKNPQNGIIMLTVDVNNSALLVAPISAIIRVIPDGTNPKRFSVIFYNNVTEVFDSDNRSELLDTIKEFRNADENNMYTMKNKNKINIR